MKIKASPKHLRRDKDTPSVMTREELIAAGLVEPDADETAQAGEGATGAHEDVTVTATATESAPRVRLDEHGDPVAGKGAPRKTLFGQARGKDGGAKRVFAEPVVGVEREPWRERTDDEGQQVLDIDEDAFVSPAQATQEMREQIVAAGAAYMEAVRRAQLPKEAKAKKAAIAGQHNTYVSRMALECIRPLSRDVNAQTVVQAATMGAAMWMLSKDFRESANAKVGNALDSARDYIDNKVMEKVNSDDPEQRKLGKRWQARLDMIKSRENGGRAPFTAHSAGLAEVALGQRAYKLMREPDADIDAVMDDYRSSVGILYDMAAEDGVSEQEVAKAARMVTGHGIAADPSSKVMFAETAHGGYDKAPDREVKLRSGGTAHVWDGAFVHRRTGRNVETGSLAPRMPMDADQHQVLVTRAIVDDMLKARTPEQMHVALLANGMGWSANQPSAVRDKVNTVGLRPEIKERLDVAGTMMASMSDDGLDAAEQQAVYSNAFVDALEEIHEKNPKMEQVWAARYGQRWREDFTNLVRDPSGFEAKMAAEAPRQGRPGPSSQRDYPEAGHSGAEFDAAEMQP